MRFFHPEAGLRTKIIHHNRWRHCRACHLHDQCNQIVLWRGIVPCHCLFIGEAPGEAEDLFGHPFVGRSGSHLETIIEIVEEEYGKFTHAFTNAIACAPYQPGGGLRAPKLDEVKACSLRLVEFVELANPRVIIYVGDIAQSTRAELERTHHGSHAADIRHPSSMLRDENRCLFYTRQAAAIVLGALRRCDRSGSG